jgi:RNase P/RNase MRP subunit p29
MEGVFESWMGLPVVVQLTLGQSKLRLSGQVLKEDEETLLIRPQCGPDLRIAKTTVLAIEEADIAFPQVVTGSKKALSRLDSRL